MAKLVTIEKVFWGGWNPEIKNRVEIEMHEIVKNENSVTLQVKHNILIDETVELEDGDRITIETVLETIRSKPKIITADEYNQLYTSSEQYASAYYPNATPLEKQALIPNIALLLFVTMFDFIDEEKTKTIYGLTPSDWKIKE